MAHDLFGSRFLGVRAPAWHALGTVIPDPIPAIEALTIAGINFTYQSVPLGYDLPDGTHVVDPSRVAVLRSPTSDDPSWRPLGFASSDYAYLQNHELASGLDALAAKTGWTLETVGALGHGERVFMTLDAGPRSVLGDEYRQYFVVSDGKTAGRALRVSLTPVRVVCQNTQILADSLATTMIRLPHSRDVALDYAFWTDLTGSLEKSREQAFLALERMASTPISPASAMLVIEAGYPLPPRNARARQHDALSLDLDLDPSVRSSALAALQPGIDSYEARLARATRHREAAFELYQRFNDGDEVLDSMPSSVRARVAGTAYAALQAVTELADWSGSSSGLAASTSALFGSRSRVKSRAWAAASALSTRSSSPEIHVPVETEDLVTAAA